MAPVSLGRIIVSSCTINLHPYYDFPRSISPHLLLSCNFIIHIKSSNTDSYTLRITQAGLTKEVCVDWLVDRSHNMEGCFWKQRTYCAPPDGVLTWKLVLPLLILFSLISISNHYFCAVKRHRLQPRVYSTTWKQTWMGWDCAHDIILVRKAWHHFCKILLQNELFMHLVQP